MKTSYVILSLIISLLSLTVNSQITKGNWMVGGDGSYFNNTINNNNVYISKYSIIEINPDIGYFIKDKLVIGSHFNFQYLSRDVNTSKYYLGIYIRYYFLNQKNIYNIFSQIDYDYNIHIADLTAIGHKYGFKLGTVVFFTNSVGLELSLGYDTNSIKFEHTDKIKTDRIKANIGFHFYLEKK